MVLTNLKVLEEKKRTPEAPIFVLFALNDCIIFDQDYYFNWSNTAMHALLLAPSINLILTIFSTFMIKQN